MNNKYNRLLVKRNNNISKKYSIYNKNNKLKDKNLAVRKKS